MAHDPWTPQLLDPDAEYVYIDRTALEWFWTCPRKFYWGRRYQPTNYASIPSGAAPGQSHVPILGLEPLANEHRAFGKLMHTMVEVACGQHQKAGTLPSPAQLGAQVTSAVMKDLAEAGQTPQQLKEFIGLGLGLAHQLVVHVLPLLLKDHNIIAVEEELLLPLPPAVVMFDPQWGKPALGKRYQLIVRVKPDLILQHKADGQLVYFEWKTTSFTNADQLTAFEINPQIQLGMAAVANKYGHCDWAQVGLFYKGQKRNGLRTSPFCYGYVCADGRISTSYVKGWNKVPIVDILQEHEQDMVWWVNQMTDEQEQGQFFMTPPVFANTTHQQAFLTQLPNLLPRLLSTSQWAYPQSLNACNGAFGKVCDYYAACYQGQEAISYKPRVPHHEPKHLTLYDASGVPVHVAV